MSRIPRCAIQNPCRTAQRPSRECRRPRIAARLSGTHASSSAPRSTFQKSSEFLPARESSRKAESARQYPKRAFRATGGGWRSSAAPSRWFESRALAVELQFDAQHAVRGRMLWPHVDDQFVRAQQGLAIVCGIDAQSRLSSAAKTALLTALNSKIFPHPGRVLLQDVIVFPQRIALPLVRQQNAFQIWVPGKNNSEHVKYFSLLPIRRGPNAHDARHIFSVSRPHFQP